MKQPERFVVLETSLSYAFVMSSNSLDVVKRVVGRRQDKCFVYVLMENSVVEEPKIHHGVDVSLLRATPTPGGSQGPCD